MTTTRTTNYTRDNVDLIKREETIDTGPDAVDVVAAVFMCVTLLAAVGVWVWQATVGAPEHSYSTIFACAVLAVTALIGGPAIRLVCS